MNKKKKIVIASVIFIFLFVVLILVNRMNSPKVFSGITLLHQGQKIEIENQKLEDAVFQGEIVNGKGEHSQIEKTGIEVSKLLEEYDIIVTSDMAVQFQAKDGYSCKVMGDEILTSGKVYLSIMQEEDSPQLFVFGDQDSKRCVRSVVQISIQ